MMQPSKWTPEAVFKRLVRRRSLPKPLRAALSWLGVLVSWYGFASSIASIASSAKWVIDVSKTVYSFAVESFPRAVVLLDGIHAGVVFWRQLTSPIHHALFGWLPFDIPREAIDIAVIVGVLVAGQVRGWLLTRDERRFRKAISDRLTKEGRIACLLQIQAAQDCFSRADALGDHDEAERMRDKAEHELVLALDDLTEDADTSRASDRIIDHILTLPPEDFKEFNWYAANLEEVEDGIRKRLMLRAGTLASLLAGIVLLDLAYASLHQA